jgi:hypothetical protein
VIRNRLGDLGSRVSTAASEAIQGLADLGVTALVF